MNTFIQLIFVGIFWNQVDARPQDPDKIIADSEEDADFWYGHWGYGGIPDPAPSSKKVIVAKVTEDIGSRADKISKSADAEPEPEADADAYYGYYGYPYGYRAYGYGYPNPYRPGYYGKRSADAEPGYY